MWPMRTRLSEIKNRLEAATPGPWDNRCLNTLDNMAKPRHIWTEYGFICELKSPLDSSVADAEFIANAPQDISDLLAVVEVYEAGLEQYEQPFDTIITDPRHPRFIDIDRGLTAREALTKAQAILDKGGV